MRVRAVEGNTTQYGMEGTQTHRPKSISKLVEPTLIKR